MTTDAAAAAPAARGKDQVYVAETELAAGALGFWGNMVQAITHIAPGLNVLLGLTFIVSYAAISAPFVYLIGGFICLLVAIVLTQLAKEFTGAGGYFLYISETIGPRFGWLTTWTYFLYDPVAVGVVLAFTGSLVQTTINQQYGVDVSWYITFFVLLAATTVFTLFGVRLSAKAMLTLTAFEVGVFSVLALSGFASPGKGGFTFQAFNPGNAPSAHGVWLGIVFTILALSGFEAVAPLSEETENPRRNLPIAIVGSVVVVAIFYAVVNWGVLVGHGVTDVKAGHFTDSSQIFDLGRRLWGGAWIIILFATINSALAVCIAIQNASTRVWFGMARADAFPKPLRYVHPRWKTPWVAIGLLTLCTIGIGIGLGAGIGPVNAFGVVGIMQTLGLIIVYTMGNAGAFWYYLNKKKGEFNLLLHFVIPLGSSVALGWVFYENVATLHPFSPSTYFDYAPLMVIIWTAVGIGILALMKLRGREDWLFKAGQAAHERLETPEEAAHRPAL